MFRTCSEINYKVYPRVRNHGQKSPRPTESMTSGSSFCKCNIYINQSRRKYKWNTLPDIWPNLKHIFWTCWEISSSIRERVQLNIGGILLWCKQHPKCATKNRTGPCILNGVSKIHYKSIKRILTRKLHIMDKELSEDLKQIFEETDMQFQLVPPHMNHRMLQNGH